MTKVHTIDLRFQGVAGVIASYVLEGEDGLIVIDPGPSSTLDVLRAGVTALGRDLSEVRHVVLTHVHLDHAGAAGTLATESGATVHVHARGAPHLERPERLLNSATQIYGEHMDALWGEMRPVPRGQLHPIDGSGLSGGEELNLGGVSLEAVATPGHAVHHLAWIAGEDLFCGDVGGIRLSGAQSPRAPTPPPDIDLEAWRDSIARLRARPVRALYLTHFGSYTDVDAHWEALLANMDLDAARVQGAFARGLSPEEAANEFTRALEGDLAREGADLAGRMRFASPAWMSVQGLARYWQKRAARERPQETP